MVSIGDGWMRPLVNPSENVKHYYNILAAILFFFVAQLLTCAWDQPFWATGLEFPGQIVAMVFVWLIIWAAQLLFCQPGQGLEKFYHRHLRAPTEVLNKHMSIGFTVPFLNLISHPHANASQVGLLIAAFVVTGVLNSIFVYAVAYHVQVAAAKITFFLRCSPLPDVEAARTQTKVADPERPQRYPRVGSLRRGGGCADAQLEDGTDQTPHSDRFQKHISNASTLCTLSGYMTDWNGLTPAYKADRGTIGSQNDHFRLRDNQLLFPDGNGTPPTDSETSATCSSPPTRGSGAIYTWLSQNVFLTLSLLILLLVGLPVSFLQQNDLYLDVGFLFTVWLTFTSAQLCTKQHVRLSQHHAGTLTAVATLLNPVLWTSLFLVCYGLAKSNIRNQPSAVVIAGFTTRNTVSDLIAHHMEAPAAAAADGPRLGHFPIGAGDVATSILNAGIVSWGLKLFEYRHQIVSSGGVTVLVTSLVASLLNVVAWPLLAHAFGVRPASWDLSFAARSVTIALGGPAMKSLGGDAGINAVGVVVNGICFQLVAGFFSGTCGFAAVAGRFKKSLVHDGWAGLVWNSRVDEVRELESLAPSPDREVVHREVQMARGLQSAHDREMRYSSDATHVGEQRPDFQDGVHSRGTARSNTMDNNTEAGQKGDDGPQPHEDIAPDPLSVVPTVAAGVTIGINAAAMGTAHLYEQKNHAAPYSALSMTMFGVFTVLFTVRGPITKWLAGMVAGADTEAMMML